VLALDHVKVARLRPLDDLLLDHFKQGLARYVKRNGMVRRPTNLELLEESDSEDDSIPVRERESKGKGTLKSFLSLFKTC
jgi:hypothetical protein